MRDDRESHTLTHSQSHPADRVERRDGAQTDHCRTAQDRAHTPAPSRHAQSTQSHTHTACCTDLHQLPARLHRPPSFVEIYGALAHARGLQSASPLSSKEHGRPCRRHGPEPAGARRQAHLRRLPNWLLTLSSSSCWRLNASSPGASRTGRRAVPMAAIPPTGTTQPGASTALREQGEESAALSLTGTGEVAGSGHVGVARGSRLTRRPAHQHRPRSRRGG